MAEDTLIEIELPFPPSINTLYATIRGRRVLSAEGRKYKKTIADMLLAKYGKAPHLPLNTYFEATYEFNHPSLIKYDIDGGIKALQDGVVEGCDPEGCTNDNRIIELHVKKSKNPEKKVLVKLRPIAQ